MTPLTLRRGLPAHDPYYMYVVHPFLFQTVLSNAADTVVSEQSHQGYNKKIKKIKDCEHLSQFTEEVCNFAWKMAIQHPPITFHSPGIGKPLKEEYQKAFHRCDPDPPNVVTYYRWPTLMHGSNVLSKGMVWTEPPCIARVKSEDREASKMTSGEHMPGDRWKEEPMDCQELPTDSVEEATASDTQVKIFRLTLANSHDLANRQLSDVA